MAAAAQGLRGIRCEMLPARSPAKRDRPQQVAIQRIQPADPAAATAPGTAEKNKIVLQPRLCTLRTYSTGTSTNSLAQDAGGITSGGGVVRPEDVDSPFFASLADYVESSRKSQDFETLSGRLAMLAFAAAVGVEVVTGDSLFRKLEVGEIAGAAAVCLAVVSCAAAFAWASSARAQIGDIFQTGCNRVVDSLIDNLVDGLFYESQQDDWIDDA